MLIASCRSYAKRSVAERPCIGAGAGGGSGFEVVPGGVGLLPHEHYRTKNTSKKIKPRFVAQHVINSLGIEIMYSIGRTDRTILSNSTLLDKMYAVLDYMHLLLS